MSSVVNQPSFADYKMSLLINSFVSKRDAADDAVSDS